MALAANLVGTNYAETIYGTSASDSVDGRGGDTPYGYGGDDRIKGGAGGDLLSGGAGNDQAGKFRHWSDAEEFGWDAPLPSCNVREAALIRDGEDVEVGDGCDVSSGEWLDPYTGSTYAAPSEIDIDHVVPLAEAWRSGASSWGEASRESYANDPNVLLSVEDNANQSKGDKGPEAWKPPRAAVWCDYAVRWIGIKEGYDLTVDEREKAALEEMLGTCEAGS